MTWPKPLRVGVVAAGQHHAPADGNLAVGNRQRAVLGRVGDELVDDERKILGGGRRQGDVAAFDLEPLPESRELPADDLRERHTFAATCVAGRAAAAWLGPSLRCRRGCDW